MQSHKQNTSLIFLIAAIISFILGIVLKRNNILYLVFMLLSIILSVIGAKNAKKENNKALKIINICVTIISSLYFIIALIMLITKNGVSNKINDLWSE